MSMHSNTASFCGRVNSVGVLGAAFSVSGAAAINHFSFGLPIQERIACVMLCGFSRMS